MVISHPFIRWLILAILLVASGVCGATGQHSSLAIVGKENVRQKDINYRIGIALAYGHHGMKEATALISLVDDVLEREVGRINGLEVTTEEMARFSEYVDRSTRAPELLKKVKRIFGNDIDAYQRIYLAPKVMNSKLRKWFSRDPEIQTNERKAIERTHMLVQTGKLFEKAANKLELLYIKQEYRTGHQGIPEVLKTYYPEGIPALREEFKEVLSMLKEGQIAPTIIENEHSYRVVRLITKSRDNYKTEEILAEKRNFDPWFLEQTLKVHMVIRNSILLNEMCQDNFQPRWLATHC